MIDKKYTKILIAKYNPSNNCNAEDGAILTVVPKKDVKIKDYIAHYFLDSLDKRTKSKYGWVKTTEPFSLEDFLIKYHLTTQDDKVIEHIRIMLESILKLPEDTPVTATYSERGIEEKEMVFTVHKVFFYKG